ncbi:hypothetical protein CR513_41623, partial [Mucuna pruriens]
MGRRRKLEVIGAIRRGVSPFKCPNTRAMILRDDDEIASNSSQETSTSSEFKVCSDDSHYDGDLLMVRRLMVRRCLILGNMCSVMIDGGSCVNIASERLVNKLALPTIVHLRLYKLKWLIKHGELIVNCQVEVAFTLGKYEDKVLYDVVPMEAIHLLLGRPWQYNRKVVYDGVRNKFTFAHIGQKSCLLLLHISLCNGKFKVQVVLAKALRGQSTVFLLLANSLLPVRSAGMQLLLSLLDCSRCAFYLNAATVTVLPLLEDAAMVLVGKCCYGACWKMLLWCLLENAAVLFAGKCCCAVLGDVAATVGVSSVIKINNISHAYSMAAETLWAVVKFVVDVPIAASATALQNYGHEKASYLIIVVSRTLG